MVACVFWEVTESSSPADREGFAGLTDGVGEGVYD